MTSLALSFNEVNFTPVQQDNQIWLKTSELAEALGYADQSGVTRIFSRNEDEFTQPALHCDRSLQDQMSNPHGNDWAGAIRALASNQYHQ